MTYSSGAYGAGAYGVGGDVYTEDPVPQAGTHPTTLALYDAIGDGITQGDDGTLLSWLDGPGHLLGVVDDIVRDTDAGPGWSQVFDPALVPFPRWLGQFVGVRAPQAAADSDVRELIVRRPAFRRGTPQALIEAVGMTLTGSRTVLLRERDGSPYRLTVVSYTHETPDPDASERAALAAKPAGLLLDYLVTSAESYDALASGPTETHTALEATASETYTTLEA